jgi:hypothetical protein
MNCLENKMSLGSRKMSYIGNIQFSRATDDDIDPDYIYYNASIINNRTNTPYDRSLDPTVRFQETRDVPILNDASKYNFSIIRFTMNGPNKDLPLFIPVIRTGADNPTNDVDLTIYSLTLDLVVSNTTGANPVNTTLSATVPLEWVPETLDTTIAPTPLSSSTQTGQDLSSRYYWCYTYSHWVNITNTAFQQAIANLQTAFNTAWTTAGNVAPAPALGIVAPYLTYNPTTNLFTLNTDMKAFGGASRTSAGTTADYNGSVYFNSNLYGMYCNFRNEFVNIPGTEKTNLIYTGPVGFYGGVVAGVPTGQNILSVGTPAGTKYFWTMVQDYESTSTLWSPIENIVFNSTLLPLVFEQTGDPVRFGQSNVGTASTNSQSAFQPIITDVALPVENAHAYRQLIYYAPQAEYRLASFQRSKQPIRQIDIQVFWRNRLDGTLYPVQMFNSSSVSVKIMFRRRGIFDYPHPAKAGTDV